MRVVFLFDIRALCLCLCVVKEDDEDEEEPVLSPGLPQEVLQDALPSKNALTLRLAVAGVEEPEDADKVLDSGNRKKKSTPRSREDRNLDMSSWWEKSPDLGMPKKQKLVELRPNKRHVAEFELSGGVDAVDLPGANDVVVSGSLVIKKGPKASTSKQERLNQYGVPETSEENENECAPSASASASGSAAAPNPNADSSGAGSSSSVVDMSKFRHLKLNVDHRPGEGGGVEASVVQKPRADSLGSPLGAGGLHDEDEENEITAAAKAKAAKPKKSEKGKPKSSTSGRHPKAPAQSAEDDSEDDEDEADEIESADNVKAMKAAKARAKHQMKKQQTPMVGDKKTPRAMKSSNVEVAQEEGGGDEDGASGAHGEEGASSSSGPGRVMKKEETKTSSKKPALTRREDVKRKNGVELKTRKDAEMEKENKKKKK
eukprot:g5787.t1